MKYHNNLARQAGMTLIELTVVLLILVGLAGLLIPYVGSFVQKTHDSTNSSNLASLNNAFIRYVTENNRLPQHMDTLVNGTTAVGTGVCPATTVPGSPYCALLDAGVFATVNYAANSVGINSLVASKISMVVNNKTDAPNKTFGSYEDMIGLTDPTVATFTGIKVNTMRDSTGALVATSDTAIAQHLAAALGKDPMDYDPGCYDYVAFGLGDANGLVSKTIAASPVHYPEDATKGPVDYYNHYIAIVRVDKSNTGANSSWNAMYGTTCSSITEPAKFLGTVMNVPAYPNSKLFGVNGSLAYAYENQAAGK